MSNKSRQPKVERATGDPNRGQPASVIAKGVGGKGSTLDTKPIERNPEQTD
jgi:hypothetical protein